MLGFQTLEGVSDIRDESDRSGMRIVVEVCHLEAIWILNARFFSFLHAFSSNAVTVG